VRLPGRAAANPPDHQYDLVRRRVGGPVSTPSHSPAPASYFGAGPSWAPPEVLHFLPPPA
ncbi:MAG: hypothetical protein ACYDHH_02655, partial [Solirubrobacteraceae bacterium]